MEKRYTVDPLGQVIDWRNKKVVHPYVVTRDGETFLAVRVHMPGTTKMKEYGLARLMIRNYLPTIPNAKYFFKDGDFNNCTVDNIQVMDGSGKAYSIKQMRYILYEVEWRTNK